MANRWGGIEEDMSGKEEEEANEAAGSSEVVCNKKNRPPITHKY